MSSITVGMLTSGGLAPCLASSVAHLIHYWSEAKKEGKIADLTIRLYIDGYKGLLTGDSFVVPQDVMDSIDILHDVGGSPIGNSRVKVRQFK
jgi:pyrophosphate--fructose-6-phosphate 1-phosphotransferase